MWEEMLCSLAAIGGISFIVVAVTIALMWAFHKFW